MPITRPRPVPLVALLLVASVASPAQARECAGIHFPDTLTVAGTILHLNGLGLREATVFDVDVFVAALYVEHTSSDARMLLRRDERARVLLHFVRDTSASRLVEEMDAGYRANSPKVASAKKRQLFGWLRDVVVGQSIVFTYVPGKGLEVSVAGEVQGTIAGREFASATLAVLIGPKVADEDLRAGMLGGRCE